MPEISDQSSSLDLFYRTAEAATKKQFVDLNDTEKATACVQVLNMAAVHQDSIARVILAALWALREDNRWQFLEEAKPYSSFASFAFGHLEDMFSGQREYFRRFVNVITRIFEEVIALQAEGDRLELSDGREVTPLLLLTEDGIGTKLAQFSSNVERAETPEEKQDWIRAIVEEPRVSLEERRRAQNGTRRERITWTFRDTGNGTYQIEGEINHRQLKLLEKLLERLIEFEPRG